MAEKFTQEVYDSALAIISQGHMFSFGGRSARTVEDLDFIAKVEGLDNSAPEPANPGEANAKAGGGKNATEKKTEEAPKVPEVPPAVQDDAAAKKKEAEELVQAKLEALNAAKPGEEKAKATKEYEDAQKALLDLG